MTREELRGKLLNISCMSHTDVKWQPHEEILDEFDRLTIELDMAGEEIVGRGEQIKTALLSLEGGALRYSQVKDENDRLKAENFLILGRANENGELYLKSREALEEICEPITHRSVRVFGCKSLFVQIRNWAGVNDNRNVPGAIQTVAQLTKRICDYHEARVKEDYERRANGYRTGIPRA